MIILLFSVLAASLGGFLFGYDTGIIAGVVPLVKMQFHLSVLNTEFIVASLVFGAFLGCIASARLCDQFGRKKTLIVAAMLYTLGTVMIYSASHVALMATGRFITGIAVGISSYVVPLYIAEIAPVKIRGSLVLLNGVMITGGEAVAFLVDCLLHHGGQWRLMILSGVIPSLLFLAMMLFSTFSPNDSDWLQRVKVRSTIFIKGYKRLIILGILLGIFQQFSGINAVMYYGPFIFKALGFLNGANQMIATFIMGLINMLFTVIALLIVDVIGRRRLFLSGILVAIISLVMLVVLHNHTAFSPSQNGKLMLTTMIFYIGGYALSIGSLFWLLIAELYPLTIRARVMSLAAAIQWLANFVVSAVFLTALNMFGFSVIFSFFAIICLLAFVLVYYLLPETNDIKLDHQRFKSAGNFLYLLGDKHKSS